MAKHHPHRFVTQGTGNMAFFYASLGLFVGFFAFTELGQLTLKEATKYTKTRIPAAETWPGFRARGEPAPRAKPGEAKMPQEAVVYPGLSKFTSEIMQCLPEQYRGLNFGAYYASEDLQKELLQAANRCLEQKDVKSVMPKTFGDVGYVFKIDRAEPMNTEVRFITQGYPRTGQQYMMLLKGWADWVASPGSAPMVSVEKG